MKRQKSKSAPTSARQVEEPGQVNQADQTALQHPAGEKSRPGTAADAEQPAEAESGPAHRRASDRIVERATQGLIRVEARRRWRTVLRRLGWTVALAVSGFLLWYCLGDQLPRQWAIETWDELQQKLAPVIDGESSPVK